MIIGTVRRTALGAALLTLLLALPGCTGQGRSAPRPTGGASAPAAAPSSQPPTAPCQAAELAGTGVHFPDAAGATIAGYLLGTGPRAVVLAAQRRLDSCSFRAYASVLAARHYRVLAFDFAGEGDSTAAPAATPSGDVAAAVSYLRSLGVTTVVLLGTSRGATAAVVAAATVTPPVAGVVSVSAPAVFDGEDARAAAARLKVPSLYLAAASDPGYPDAARSLYDASRGSARRLLIVDGSRHGIALLSPADPDSTQATAAIDTFLTSVAPPA